VNLYLQAVGIIDAQLR